MHKELFDHQYSNYFTSAVQLVCIRMEQLPVELRRAIIERVDLPTLKSLRLISRLWAELGEEYLISDVFKSLPYRPDTARLLSLSQHPKFSYRITTVKFLHGEVNEYHARHNTYFMLYTLEAETRVEEMNAFWDAYAKVKEKKDEYLATSCDQNTLTSVFNNLPNLRTIEVSLMENPFQEDHPELLRDLWSMPTTRHLPRVPTTERLTNILVAAYISNLTIKTLSHDRLPLEFFCQYSSVKTTYSTVFENLTSLSLAIDYSGIPNSLHATRAFENLAILLKAARPLQVLNLEFQSRRKINISPVFSALQEDNYVFHSLTHISLKGILTSELELGGFLVQQKSSLCHVQLGGLGVKTRYLPANGGVHLSVGSFGGLFERLKTEMNLESLRVQGDLRGVESGERWVLEEVDDVVNLGEYVID